MLPTELERRLAQRVRQVQREARAPGLVAGLVRNGELAWTLGVGAFDVNHPENAPDAYTAFAIGSITKTFTAVLVMALRDEGRLALGDALEAHLPGTPFGEVTIRELLAHAAGLQREAPGDMWDSLQIPPTEQVLAGLGADQRVLPARLRWHYSNLAYSLLGELVARLDGRAWADSLQARVLDPLGMRRTGLEPGPERAVGYYPHPWTDQVHVEPWLAMNAFEAAGGLWSTVDDLGRWARFLCDGADGVLRAGTLEEMTRPEIMADLERWTMAWGLGLQLFRSGERVLAGHGGGMPGFLAGLAVRRAERVAAVVLCNSGAFADAPDLAVELVCSVLDEDPPAPAPWRPGPAVPAAIGELVGRWWSEGTGFTFTARDGRLECRVDGLPGYQPPAVFEPIAEDVYRTLSGREEGEILRVTRDTSGAVCRLHWAGYPFTREPRAFG